MSGVEIRKAGRTGRITLRRPKSLNAVTQAMVREMFAALPGFADDPEVTMLVIDAEGDKAFSAGGDIAGIYEDLASGRHDAVRRFWREEYALNAALFDFPKPVATFLQGFTMGGGVGVGCHGSHRIVGETSRIAMPECTIGLVPDVGGSLLLARAPGRLGEYLGTTGARMGPGDAIRAGFADFYLPQSNWPELIATLEESGDWEAIDRSAKQAPAPTLDEARINEHFGGETLGDILRSLALDDSDWAKETRATLGQNAPLSMACAVELIHRACARDRIDEALRQEYRFVHRSLEKGDFAEGIRATIIDKDRSPKWSHDGPEKVTPAEVSAMLRPLGAEELKL